MELREMEIFKEVYELESMTKAANALFITQPAVSKAISNIEKKLNLKLFLRKKGIIKRTVLSSELYERVCEILKQVDNLSQKLNVNQVVHLSSSITIGKTILADIMKQYTHDMRKIKITISNAQEIYESVIKGNTDLAIVEGSFNNEVLDSFKMGEIELNFFQHKENMNSLHSLDSLLEKTLLLREKGSSIRDAFDGLLKSKGLKYEPIWESVNSETIIHAVKNDLGIGLLPRILIDINEFNIITIPTIYLSTSVELIVRKDKGLSVYEKELFELIKKFRF